jgi:hypothetical protein
MTESSGRWTTARCLVDAWLQRGPIRLVCLTLLGLCLTLLVVMFLTSDSGRTYFGPQLGADFAGFYNAGRILNLPGPDPDRLYDLPFQNRMYHELLPNLDEDIVNPFVHPPLVAWLFRPLALLPYEMAFAVWLVISAGLYACGVLLVGRSLPGLSRSDRLDALLIALAFEPFLMECWVGGQFAAVAFFFLAVATHLELAGRPFRSGLALGVLLYKPTMLVLLLPLLAVARRWKTLAGVTVTGVIMAGLSFLILGESVCLSYARTLLQFAGTTTGSSLVLKEWKWVDLNFFTRLLLGGPSLAQKLLCLLLILPPLTFLVRAWARLDRAPDHRTLVWAAGVTGTLIVNLYVGIYDTVLVVLAALLTAGVLLRRTSELPAGFRYLLVLLFVTPWLTQPLAATTGLQVYTLVLTAFGGYQLAQAEPLVLTGEGLRTLPPGG